jgi:tripartite-type tricarboxylate transporter receptor subunit TctC
LAGQVDYTCTLIAEISQHALAGTVKVYAIGTAERNPTLPNVPTSVEAGLPEFQAAP